MQNINNLKGKKAVVTGGAGFIGSHIVDHLVSLGAEVTVIDNLRTGSLTYIEDLGSKITFLQGDILETAKITRAAEGAEVLFHLAANADVRGGMNNTYIDLRENVEGTHSVLEAARHCGVKAFVFASSATVYGEPSTFPTSEENPLLQTSVYGASKLAAEAYIQAYTEYFSIPSYIFRFVSWIGERYSHGVIFDFVKKLFRDAHSLEILGDGSQKKSYLYVKDGVSGIFHALEKSKEGKNIFNLGHDEWMNVTILADIVCEEMALKDVSYRYTGGKRGWIGDSPFVHLDTSRLKSLGWKPATSIEEGIRRTVRYLLQHRELLTARD